MANDKKTYTAAEVAQEVADRAKYDKLVEKREADRVKRQQPAYKAKMKAQGIRQRLEKKRLFAKYGKPEAPAVAVKPAA